MNRTRALVIAALMALVPATEAMAQSRERPDRDRDRDRPASEQRREAPSRERQMEAPRADLGSVVRRVGAGRDGRMLGVSPRGDTVVVRWEYPGGRVADISVDARTGRVTGEN